MNREEVQEEQGSRNREHRDKYLALGERVVLLKKQSESLLSVRDGGGWRADQVRKLVRKGFVLARVSFPVPLKSHHLCATRHLPGPGQRLYQVTAQQALMPSFSRGGNKGQRSM